LGNVIESNEAKPAFCAFTKASLNVVAESYPKAFKSSVDNPKESAVTAFPQI